MPPQEQAELWMQLRDRMKVDWQEMTLQEKKAGMYTTFGHKDTNKPYCIIVTVVPALSGILS